MAQAIVTFKATAGQGGANLQRFVYEVTFHGDDVSEAIAIQRQLEIEISVPNSFTTFDIDTEILRAVKALAITFGLTVATTDIRAFKRSRLGSGEDAPLAYVNSLAPWAWYRFGLGITSSATFVSQWDDQSGNSRHFKQATASRQPVLLSYGSILFDGINQFLQTDLATLNQPLTVFLLCKQVTWTLGNTFISGGAGVSGNINQRGVTPQIGQNSGVGAITNGELALNTWGIVSGVINGAASQIQINKGVPQVGNPGANNPGGLTLGADATSVGCGNIQVKELIVFPSVLDAGKINVIVEYLAFVGGLSIQP